MGKVSHLRLIILSCVILFTIGETTKVDSENASKNATADNMSNEKGLLITIFLYFLYVLS